MNYLRSHKSKLNITDNHGLNNTNSCNKNNNNNNISNNDNSANNTNTNNNKNSCTTVAKITSPSQHNGLLTKITKRYSTLSNRITRRHQSGNKSNSPQKVASGSYDMTGAHSDDHRLEIGAPVLISSTTVDADRFIWTEGTLKQVGGDCGSGIGGGGGVTVIKKQIVKPLQIDSAQSSPQIPSSSNSENEVFVDALSLTPPKTGEDKFVMALADSPNKSSSPCSTSAKESSPEFRATTNTPEAVNKCIILPTRSPTVNYYETPKLVRPTLRKQHSKSAQNLHRSEIKMYLQKTPSVALDMNLTTANLDHCHVLPKLPELFGESKCNLADTYNDANDADKENSSSSVIVKIVKSEPNTPTVPPEKKIGGGGGGGVLLLANQQQTQKYKSIDSLDIHRANKRTVYTSNTSIDEFGSKCSLASHSSTLDGFNMKSVSCSSLNGQNVFVSIDELNEITQQINQSEDFNYDIDFEYCKHRDKLKPSERRITLLKNKNTGLALLNHNKDKLKKSWTGVKNWVGEESVKLKDAVNKSGTLQRIAGSKLSLNHMEKRGDSKERELRTASTLSISGEGRDVHQTESNRTVTASCDNIVEEDAEFDGECSYVSNCDDSPRSNHLLREGQNGFEEIRRYVKQGGDFGKELMLILQERVDSEMLYSKSLSKMANKLNKACRDLPGSIADAWRGVATEMENRSDIHRQLSVSLTEEIVKPLKNITDNHHKARKSVESNVDKAARVLSEWRVSESKAKKASHIAARENEKLQDAMWDARIQKSPSIALLHQGINKTAAEKEIKSAEKDCAKLDNKRKKAEDAVKRADVEYYTLCVRAERARVDWEMSVLRGSTLLQGLENQRLVSMKTFVTNYANLTANMNPILDNLVQRLQPQVDGCNVIKDMQIVKNIRRSSEGPSEQLLPDFYCEHTTLAMNRERRKHALVKLLQLVKTDLERERRSRNGLKGLSQSLNNQENQNITDKLYHIRSMLTYLEGARFKLQSALLELDHKPRTSHPLAQHIQITRDRTGLQQSVLKVPLWLKNNDRMSSNNPDDITEVIDYDCTPPAIEMNPDSLNKNFNRSKSNIETFRNITTVGTINSNLSQTTQKTRTISSNMDDPYSDRGQADGGSNQQDSDFDEFSSQEEDDDQRSGHRKEQKVKIVRNTIVTNGSPITPKVVNASDNLYQNSAEIHAQEQCDSINVNNSDKRIILSRCKALYSYTPKLYDELELNPGDIIEVHAKQEDGWWLGALGKNIGIFPATYVEEFA